MSTPARISTLIFASGPLSLTGNACGAKTQEVSQLAAKKLATDSTPAPQAVENPQDDSIAISHSNGSPGGTQLEPNQASPDSTGTGDASKDTNSTNTKTTTAKGDTPAANTSTDGKQSASDTTLTGSLEPGSQGWASLEEKPRLAIRITYAPIWASVVIDLRDEAPRDETIQAVRQAVRSFPWPPSPGGPLDEGWAQGKSARSREIEVLAAQVPGVYEVFGVLIGCEARGAPDPISMRPQELPELMSLSVQLSIPQTLEEMLAGPIKTALVKATAQAPTQGLPKPTATPTPGDC